MQEDLKNSQPCALSGGACSLQKRFLLNNQRLHRQEGAAGATLERTCGWRLLCGSVASVQRSSPPTPAKGGGSCFLGAGRAAMVVPAATAAGQWQGRDTALRGEA